MTDTPLPSWNDGNVRDRILRFVEAADAVPPEERIAVFDNDGTLWTERPMPPQLHFLVEQWREAAAADPTLREQQPYRAVAGEDQAWIGRALEHHHQGDDSDLQLLMRAIIAGVNGRSVEEYQDQVAAFYASAQHPGLKTSYRFSVYKPMIELLRYLEMHGFSCYIVSGGDRDFMRSISVEYYGLPWDHVIGSTVGLAYDTDSGELRYGSTFEYFDDGPEKPVRIWSRLGRRPMLAVGNSDGDLPMLYFTRRHGPALSILIHHDDDTGRGDTPYDSGTTAALAAAENSGIAVASVKNDWAEIFPTDRPSIR